VEKLMADNHFMNDAMEGLEQVKNQKNIELVVDQLNRDLRKKIDKKIRVKQKRRLKEYPWIYFAVFLLLSASMTAPRMARAAEDLAQGRLGSAGESQQKAIDQLRRGGQAVAQQLLQQMARQGGMMKGDGPGSGEDEDPFGRPQASYGQSYGESVRVPDKMDIQKAREILEELQRRAAERGRPTNELDYLDRLLRRF